MASHRTTILLHTIEFWYRDFNPDELPESDEDHIKTMINDGCQEGELCFCDSNASGEVVTYRGWWKIVTD